MPRRLIPLPLSRYRVASRLCASQLLVSAAPARRTCLLQGPFWLWPGAFLRSEPAEACDLPWASCYHQHSRCHHCQTRKAAWRLDIFLCQTKDTAYSCEREAWAQLPAPTAPADRGLLSQVTGLQCSHPTPTWIFQLWPGTLLRAQPVEACGISLAAATWGFCSCLSIQPAAIWAFCWRPLGQPAPPIIASTWTLGSWVVCWSSPGADPLASIHAIQRAM